MEGFLQAALLGLLQGLTEFLPVSSSGHLALAQLLFAVEGGGLTLSVMLHAGTLAATLLVLWRRVADATRSGLGGVLRPRSLSQTVGGRDALFVVVASVPTALLGLSLRDVVARWTESPTAVGLGFVITTVALVSTRWAPAGNADGVGWLGAVLVGVAQGLAVAPGVSRSGITIVVALWLGVRSDRAFELSMLMSLPAVLGAVLLEWRHLENFQSLGSATLGASVAFASGVAALVLLRGLVTRGALGWFALWVAPLAIATLAMARAWPVP